MQHSQAVTILGIERSISGRLEPEYQSDICRSIRVQPMLLKMVTIRSGNVHSNENRNPYGVEGVEMTEAVKGPQQKMYVDYNCRGAADIIKRAEPGNLR